MADAVSFRVEGAAALDRALAQIDDVTQGQVLRRAALAGAEILRDGMVSRAPRERGDLAAGIRIQALEVPTGAEADIGPGHDAFYGMFLEFGTVKMAARPFMRPTVDADGPTAVTEAMQVLEREIAREVEKARRAGSR